LRGLHPVPHGRRVGHVDPPRQRPDTEAVQLLLQVRGGLFVAAVAEGDVVPVPRQPQCDGPADAAPAAADQGDRPAVRRPRTAHPTGPSGSVVVARATRPGSPGSDSSAASWYAPVAAAVSPSSATDAARLRTSAGNSSSCTRSSCSPAVPGAWPGTAAQTAPAATPASASAACTAAVSAPAKSPSGATRWWTASTSASGSPAAASPGSSRTMTQPSPSTTP